MKFMGGRTSIYSRTQNGDVEERDIQQKRERERKNLVFLINFNRKDSENTCLQKVKCNN